MQQRFGTAHGKNPEGLLTGEVPVNEAAAPGGLPPGLTGRKIPRYSIDRALEHNDHLTLVKDMGLIKPDDPILRNFEPEEIKVLRDHRLLSKKYGVGADDLLASLKNAYPDRFGYDTDADFIRAIIDGSIQKGLNRDSIKKHY